MTDRLQINRNLCLVAIVASLTFGSTLSGKALEADDAYSRNYWTDAKMFSLHPDQELATYRSYPSGGTSPNGTVILGVGDKDRRFNVAIVGKLKSNRFMATVTVKPFKDDTRTKAQEIEYDLSDLNPRSLEIGRDDDGPVYRLSLVPSIQEIPKPKTFDVKDLHLESWHFPASPVILDDQEYIGQWSMSGGPLAWCDIPGLAKIEFSLLHLKGASPLGTLEKGVIQIEHDGTTLRIANVMNGAGGVLAGGPHRLWVRWNKPTQSIEEYRESIKTQIAKLRERVKNGDQSVRPGALEQLEKKSESDRIGREISSGLRAVKPEDIE